MRKCIKVELVCKFCKNKFYVNEFDKNRRKYCSHECYSNDNKGSNWKGSTLRGKGSRGPYSEDRINAISLAKFEKRIKRIKEENILDFDLIKNIVNEKYVAGLGSLMTVIGHKRPSDKTNTEELHKWRILAKDTYTVIKYLNLENEFKNTSRYKESICLLPFEREKLLKEIITTCDNYIDYTFQLEKHNFSMYLLRKNIIQPFIVDHNLKTNIFTEDWFKNYGDKYGTLPERKVKQILLENNIIFEEQAKIMRDEFTSDGHQKFYKPDFLIGKKIIEVNGDYWHANPLKYSILNEKQISIQQNDQRKYKFYKENGYDLMVIWEMELNNSYSDIKNKLQKYLGIN